MSPLTFGFFGATHLSQPWPQSQGPLSLSLSLSRIFLPKLRQLVYCLLSDYRKCYYKPCIPWHLQREEETNRQREKTQSTSGNYFFFLCTGTKRHARYLLFRLFSLHSLPPRRLTGSKQTLSENTLPQTSSHNAYTYSRSFCGSLLSILSASSSIVTFLPTSTIDQTPFLLFYHLLLPSRKTPKTIATTHKRKLNSRHRKQNPPTRRDNRRKGRPATPIFSFLFFFSPSFSLLQTQLRVCLFFFFEII